MIDNEDEEFDPNEAGDTRPSMKGGSAKVASIKAGQAGQAAHVGNATHSFHGHLNASLKSGRGSKQRDDQITPTLTDEIFDREPVQNNFNRR